MKMVIQRVTWARVLVGAEVVGEIGPGLLVFLCIEKGDEKEVLDYWIQRLPVLRVFGDAEDKMNRSLPDIGGSVLVVSQFTLVARLHKKGRRPSFEGAEAPERAEALVRYFVEGLRRQGVPVAEGRFGALMAVELLNDGPVTFIVDEPPRQAGRGEP
ncbi:MAG: D-aminoacyl-tRNA deacylase [Acidobacteria bacterium]|nr:D-aminoacyl-tRNA deacylase [Acidobacteriota bacterium]MDW7984815.1 D-aminoacyl-tRNA deacylase [Acidobacteriota bacterium]